MYALRRSTPSISRLSSIRRLTTSSSPSAFIVSASKIDEGDGIRGGSSLFRFLLGSVSVGVGGVGLGLLWFRSSSIDSLAIDDRDEIGGLEYFDSVESEKKKPKYIFGDAFRRKVFFNYEKRIRMRSPPEKVFEYFASHRTPEGEVFMTPADLMRAIVPVFPPSESSLVREGYLRGERDPGELCCGPSSFFMLFDTNSDGLISFAEYIFFVTLLSIPESSFAVAFKMFDLNSSGDIDKEEFKKVMALMRAHNRQGAHHRDGLRTGLRVGCSVDNGGLLEFFFGKDGSSSLKHEEFVTFLRDLHEEILRLEFAHYDYKRRGTISAKDFALSMVASADMSHISKFLGRADNLSKQPHLKDLRISLEEFMTFAELRKSLEPLTLAIFSYGKVNGLLSKQDFQRACSNVCGVSLTDKMVDIIFHLFDTNGDGTLSIKEFVRVLQRREKDIAQPTHEAGVIGFLFSWLRSSKNSQVLSN
ncbi:hypothetical protein GIB67_014837 [Kingdonia uniflora]|uniref:EF-hand domain-containing protein n=1 Tax=Kingdonia uniflora TaxID=39325 RepID=A0A7J7MT57_9MAGN|nr:hypothetical protein GIB67_014837 [Kingdonia uniflora]